MNRTNLGKRRSLTCFFAKNHKLPHYIARRYKHHDLDHEDIAGFASVGMMKAFNSFELSKGYKFITYATRLMMNEVLMQFRKVEYKKQKFSLDAPTSNSDDNDVTLLDMLPDSSIAYEQDFEQIELVKQIMCEAKTFLTEKEYYIVSNIISDEPKTQRQMSEELNISQSYVSRLEASALKKIRDYLEKQEVQSDKKNEGERLIVTQPTTKVHIEGITLMDKVRYALKHYPDMKTEDIANAVGTTKAMVYNYASKIKRESKGEKVTKPSTAPVENINSELEKLRKELKSARDVAKDALDKMVAISDEKEELSKCLDEALQRIATLEDVKAENEKLSNSLRIALHEQKSLQDQLEMAQRSNDNHAPNQRTERLTQLNHLLMAEILELSN